VARDPSGGLVEIIHLVERADLGLVGEEDVDVPLDELEELHPMAVDAESVGQRKRHRGGRIGRGRHHGAEGVLRVGFVPEIPLDVNDPGGRDDRQIDIVRVQLARHTERRVHRALRIGRDADQTASRARLSGGTGGRCVVERDTSGADVMPEDLAEFVVGDLADERHRQAERREPGRGVGCGPAGDLDRRRHVRIDRAGPISIGEGHGTLVHPVPDDEIVVGLGEDIDDRIADADDVEGTIGGGSERSHRARPYAGAVTETELSPADPYRLPIEVRPVRYDLTLEPDLEAATFAGTVDITMLVDAPVDSIRCNAIELDVTSAELVDHEGRAIAITGVSLDTDAERITFDLDESLAEGAAHLRIGFTGVLNDKLRGFYRSTFVDTDGVEQTIATTQFEATDARRAFPCWDEPEFKASFAVTLVVDADLFAVSNAAEIERVPDAARAGKHRVRFADTMVMSTYLVAFIVGPLEATDPVDVDGIPLRVIYPRGKGHLTSYALEVGAFCLRHFANYYGIAYPGDKLDLVAVPDFAFGAMENLGCVTFREILLLVDPDTTTQAELLNVTDVINHELAHMWFGDLVTMKWWNGIWLNEAFATFMEMHATDAFRPLWERWVTFGLARTAAFDTDSLTNTRPVEYPVISPADAEGMFDILTYEKGAAVVRMLEQYLGEDEFRTGIRQYLAAHAYGNTETTDLWDAIEQATGEPVRRIMDSWIFQGGFPVISADVVNDGRTLRLSQHRFGYAGDLGDGEAPIPALDDAANWIVPLIFSQRSATDGVITFEKVLLEGPSIDIDLIEPVEWVLVNTEGTGFYRARYARDLRAALIAHAHTDLSPIERYGLIDDIWASVLAGDLEAHDFLEAAEAFAAETDLSVWQRIIGGLNALDRIVDGDARESLRARVHTLLSGPSGRLGPEPVDGESDRDRALRGVLFEALGVLGNDSQTQSRARVLLDIGSLDPDPALTAAAVNIVAATGTAAEFDGFIARMKAATNPQEELRFLGALADFPDPELMTRLVRMSITDEIRTQNAPLLLRRALTNRDSGEVAWFFVSAEWDTINDRFPSNSIARLLEGIRSLSRPGAASEILVFFETHEVPQGDKILAQHLERLEVNVALRVRESERLGHTLLHGR
jgi:puromycin-sensitive aminopeptidase